MSALSSASRASKLAGSVQPQPLSRLLAQSKDPGARTSARGGKRAAGARQGRHAQQAPARHGAASAPRTLAPAEALNLLLVVRPGECPPGEAVAPAAFSQADAGAGRGRALPAALSVRNTFLDEPLQRSESLERFIEPRVARSAPNSGRLEIATALDDEPVPPFMINTPTESAREGMLLTPRMEAMTWPRTPDPEPATPRMEVMSWPCPASPSMFGRRGMFPSPPVLNLSEVLPQDTKPRWDPLMASTSSTGSRAGAAQQDTRQELGSSGLPSRGSALHRYGACKPCAFVFREGCRGGVDCQFCHLCDANERKARKKERLAAKRESREEGRQLRQVRVGGA